LIREPVALGDLASAARPEVEAPAKAEDKEVKLEIQPDVQSISMDRNLIYRVVSDLLLNAVKHTGLGASSR